MASVLNEFRKRRDLLSGLRYDEAGIRISAFGAWLEKQKETSEIINGIKKSVDVEGLLKDCDAHNPPRAGSLEEVVAVGLFFIENCKSEPQLWRLSHTYGITPSYSTTSCKDLNDEIIERFVEPAIDFIQEKLQEREETEISDIEAIEYTVSDLKEAFNKVFIVHGHEHGVKEEVARFIEKLGLEPIILHEQPNKGRTIIEKFEDYADVHFAIVLLMGDDFGKAKDGSKDLRLRVRQNVILELGYFLGKLGRDKVCAVYENGVEIPSDYSGVLFVPLDKSGKWKFDVVKELKAAGFDVDVNKLYES